MKDLSKIKPVMETTESIQAGKRFYPATESKQAFITIKNGIGCMNLQSITGYEGLSIGRITAFGEIAERLNKCNQFAVVKYKAPKKNEFIRDGQLVSNGVDLQTTEVITDQD